MTGFAYSGANTCIEETVSLDAHPANRLTFASKRNREYWTQSECDRDDQSRQIIYVTRELSQNDVLQTNWGRINHEDQKNNRSNFVTWYRFVQTLQETVEPAVFEVVIDDKPTSHVLETLEGYVDAVRDDIAYVTLTGGPNDVLEGQYSAAELETHGIKEGNRFYCIVEEQEGKISLKFTLIPKVEISEERAQQIRDRIWSKYGNDDDDD